ncbi:HAD-superfamily hydrolase, subfamily IIA [Syncephalis pseudoplumigaleata]|uniref:4-nitrophenylphosphatase n=1 Tax=Syncephalis pseudoplumigaleata TaxID=1712513 RepID=A0A4P9Z2F9_9FUNG|nr:HAD-superfamily hydrolase, subfamily IIA [Syncephalis pseudoplumigaleata]|eukprot:RKP26703.1 HAD-superfamily hydrolase, subfamily IIA [Syncephalis pseudoplumigaleata]
MIKNQEELLSVVRSKKAFICDMDGVIYHGDQLLPGAEAFVEWCKREGKHFLFLTNNSAVTPRELQMKMRRLGIDIPEERFYTSAIATAKFLASQKPNGTCYVVGEPGLTNALYEAGFIMNDVNPDFVVIGEGRNFSWEKMAKATRLVMQGAKLIATNIDANGPGQGGTLIPACGAFTSSIEVATGRKAFYCGKPNALMMRYAQRILGCKRHDTCIIGDRMDTDVAAGIGSEIDAVLVLSGVTKENDLDLFAYQPYAIIDGIFNIPDPVGNETSNASNDQ